MVARDAGTYVSGGVSDGWVGGRAVAARGVPVVGAANDRHRHGTTPCHDRAGPRASVWKSRGP